MVNYNPFAPEVKEDPYPYYAALRREHPVYRTEMMGAYVVTRYEDVQHVMKNTEVFSSTGMGTGYVDGRPTNSVIICDPPDHTRLRSILNRAFTPRIVADLEPRIREITTELLGGLGEATEFDLISGLALPLPVRVIAEMLGVEPARQADFKRWSDMVVSSVMRSAVSPEQQAREQEDMRSFFEYFRSAMEDRRRNPGSDLISALVRAEEQHQALSSDEVLAFTMLLLVAGNETTTNLLGNLVLALLRNPDQLELLRRDRSLIPNAIEEALRYDAPVQMLFRLAMHDTQVAGVDIPKGSMVLPVFAAANRDEQRYPDPDRFDVTRSAAGHMAFGYGIHFCLGAPLARVEGRVALEMLLDHLPDFHLGEGPYERVDPFFLRGVKHLPLVRAARPYDDWVPRPFRRAFAWTDRTVRELAPVLNALLRRRRTSRV